MPSNHTQLDKDQKEVIARFKMAHKHTTFDPAILANSPNAKLMQDVSTTVVELKAVLLDLGYVGSS